MLEAAAAEEAEEDLMRAERVVTDTADSIDCIGIDCIGLPAALLRAVLCAILLACRTRIARRCTCDATLSSVEEAVLREGLAEEDTAWEPRWSAD